MTSETPNPMDQVREALTKSQTLLKHWYNHHPDVFERKHDAEVERVIAENDAILSSIATAPPSGIREALEKLPRYDHYEPPNVPGMRQHGRGHWIYRPDLLQAIASLPGGEPADAFDFQRVLAWWLTPNHRPAHLAFTEGPERQAAYLLEAGIQDEALPLAAAPTETEAPKPNCGGCRLEPDQHGKDAPCPKCSPEAKAQRSTIPLMDCEKCGEFKGFAHELRCPFADPDERQARLDKEERYRKAAIPSGGVETCTCGAPEGKPWVDPDLHDSKCPMSLYLHPTEEPLLGYTKRLRGIIVGQRAQLTEKDLRIELLEGVNAHQGVVIRDQAKQRDERDRRITYLQAEVDRLRRDHDSA